jgi:peroxiredoxin
MAGAGYRTFQSGEVLTSNNVQTYLMDQAVQVYAGTAERGSAVPTPSTGMVAYSTATGLQVFDGSVLTAPNHQVVAVAADLLLARQHLAQQHSLSKSVQVGQVSTVQLLMAQAIMVQQVRLLVLLMAAVAEVAAQERTVLLVAVLVVVVLELKTVVQEFQVKETQAVTLQ